MSRALRSLLVEEEIQVAKSADQIDVHIGGRVRLRRMMLNMSQEQLGAALGVTFQQIQKYEKGLNRIGAGRLYHLASVLNVQPAFFYDGLPCTQSGEQDPALEKRSAETTAFLATPEGYAIVLALSKIQDPNVRKRFLDLARAVADVEETLDPLSDGH